MVIEGFDEIINTVYIAKKLFDMGNYALVEESFLDLVEFDIYYENMSSLIENTFIHYNSWYYGRHNMEAHMFSDPVIVDFYILAGEYGRMHDIPDENNPYISMAQNQVDRWLNFSYCIGWKLMGHTKPKRPYQSRLAVFVYQDDWIDLGDLAYGLVEIYGWFEDACAKLRELVCGNQANSMQLLKGEEVAA